MGLSATLATGYLIPAAVLWALLAAAVTFDALRSRRRAGGSPPSSGRLHAAVAAVTALYALSAAASAVSSSTPAGSALDAATSFVAIVVEDTAEAGFIALLLAIAAGYGITRPPALAALGPHRRRVTVVPGVYFIASLIVDVTEEVAERAGGGGGGAGQGTGAGAALFNGAEVVSLVALLLAWLFIFDLISRTREELEGPGEGMVGAQPPASVAAGAGVVGGAPVPLPPTEAAAVAAGEADPARLYARLHGGGAAGATAGSVAAAPATVADAVARAGKARLLKRFRVGVTAYVGLRAAAIVLPLLLLSAPGEEAAAVTGVLVAEGVVRLSFLAALAAIFRPVPDSPYLLLDEEGGGPGDGGPGGAGAGGAAAAGWGDDGAGGFDASTARASAALSTELGVLGAAAPAPGLGPLDPAPPPRRPGAPAPQQPPRAQRAAASPDPRFVLDDGGGGDGWGAAPAHAPAPAAGAARGPPPRNKRADSTEEVPL